MASPRNRNLKGHCFMGSGKFWTKLADANFHMTYVVEVSATGDVAPPLLRNSWP